VVPKRYAAWVEDLWMNTSELRANLKRLQTERIEAEAVGLGGNEAYMSDLENEISYTRAAFVGAAVTEIAIARGDLYGRLFG
jgi:hypothetical protein